MRTLKACRSKQTVAKLVREIYSHRVGAWGIGAAQPNESLGGYCAVASRVLASAFLHKGWPAEVVANEDHAWVESGGKIFDVTATQFGGPKIAIIPNNQRKQFWFTYEPDEEDCEWIWEEPEHELVNQGLELLNIEELCYEQALGK